MAGFQDLVEFIQNGERVNAGVTNRPIRQIDGNARYLRDVIDTLLAGETVIARGRTINSSVLVGQPVYYNPTSQQFEAAIALTETDTTTNQLVTAKSSQVWGIVLTKTNATKADILLHGVADADLSSAVDGDVTAGLYYLSGSEAGKLTSTRPPVGVQVLQVSQESATAGKHEVYVNTKFLDFLEQHRHVKFRLAAVPAGTHSPPSVGSKHVITSEDTATEGWLPASHSSFNGLAPSGAKFGYNLAASTLGQIWPPIPVENAVIELSRASAFDDVKTLNFDFAHDFPLIAANSEAEQAFPTTGVRVGDKVIVTADTTLPAGMVLSGWVSADDVITLRLSNITAGALDPASTIFHVGVIKDIDDVTVRFQGFERMPEAVVRMDVNGIWWMTDCYNEVPWPTNLDTANPTSESLTESCPVNIGDVIIDLWYTNQLFFTNDSAVLSLRGKAGSGIVFRCVNTDDEKAVGHLEADLSLGLLVDDRELEGNSVVKNFDGNIPVLGPVVESVMSASAEISVTEATPGNLVLQANLDIAGTEFPVDTVRLDGVGEEFFSDVLALGFPSGRASEFRGRIRVPSHLTLPSGTQMKIRFWVLGRVADTIPANVFTVTRRNLTKPTAVLTDKVALPLTDTALPMTTGAVIGSANEYILMETDPFDIATGDKVLFTLSRSASDGYSGELQIIYQEGILVAGS